MNLGRKIVLVIAALVALAAAIFLVRRWIETGPGRMPSSVQEVPAETRSVTLYFATRDATGMESETREIPVGEGMENEVEAVVGALLAGPLRGEGISAFPPGTRLLRAFWVEEASTLFLDFSRALVSAHPGGSTSEYYTITSAVRTIGANFPQVRKLQFLVEGYPVESIAGHYAADRPIEIMRWR